MAGRAQDWLEGRRPEVVPARSAATVMILRDRPAASGSDPNGSDPNGSDPISGHSSGTRRGAGGGVEVFMLRRATTMEFAPRMMVFPGGGVDPRDGDPGLPWAGPSPAEWGRLLMADEATARELVIAAVREVFEECGVLLAGPDDDCVVGDVSSAQWQAEREALSTHRLSFAQMLIGRGLMLRSDLLRARAHWVTPECEPRRYDTRIFAALMPVGQTADDQTSEADHADWVDPHRLLRDYASGTALMLPPTLVCVEQAAASACVADFLAAKVHLQPVTPVPVLVDGAVLMRCTLPSPSGPLAPAVG